MRFLGNAGGYLGLFLGYAMLHVPELLRNGFKWTKKSCCSNNVKPITNSITKMG